MSARRSLPLVVLGLVGLLATIAAAEMRATITQGPREARGKQVILRLDGTWQYIGAQSTSGRLRDKLTLGQAWGEQGTQPGQFYFPCGIAVDGSGDIYVADKANHRIQVFSPGHSFRREWKVDYSPVGLTFGPEQALYVTTDVGMGAPAVRVYDTHGKRLRAWGTAGTGDGQFGGSLGGVAVDGDGHVFI
ncbi:NHL repeat-containing protein, partial [Candidatus Latescibacterota bacterium]